jgi:hypothetical protein
VRLTFNAVLKHESLGTFSPFYGLDYKTGNKSFVSDRLTVGSPMQVNSVADCSKLPTDFEPDDMVNQFSNAFDSSGVRVVQVTAIVFVIFRIIDDAGN